MLSILFSIALAAPVEPRQKIVIIDTGKPVMIEDRYVCNAPHLDLTNTRIEDFEGHGTVMTNIIQEKINPKTQCLLFVKWYHSYRQWKKSTKNETPELVDAVFEKALTHAMDQHAVLINISVHGELQNAKEEQKLKQALSQGAIVVVAAGNSELNLGENCASYPACYAIKHPNFHVVANYKNGRVNRGSNYGGPVTDKADGDYMDGDSLTTGTSQATARVTAELAKKLRRRVE